MVIKKRMITWAFIIVFLLGEMFGGLTADPLSDMLFFIRSSSGVPLSPIEQVFYWSYLPSIIYALLAVVATIFAVLYYKKVKPIWFIIVVLLLTGISTLISMFILGITPTIVIMMIIPFAALMFITFYEFVFKHGKHIFKI
jgi:hypothetical protein